MAKATKTTRKAYVATRTIHAGTPKKPEIIAPGDEVEGFSAEEIKDLLASGAIREEKVKGGKADADDAEGDDNPPPAQ